MLDFRAVVVAKYVLQYAVNSEQAVLKVLAVGHVQGEDISGELSVLSL